MRLPLIWALLLFPAGSLAQSCPADCQCNQPQTVFCIARRSPAVPQGLPLDTAHLYMFESGLRLLNEDSFAGLPALRLLDLSQNLIASLPRNVFQPLPGLHNLDLSSNQLQEVTNESFHGLRLLERLYLDCNQLQIIHPAAFDSLENLLELKLQDNQLQTVPPLNLPTLLLLDISRNKITALETGTFHVRSLESLKMAGLGLGSVDEELLQNLRNLHELDVSDNLLARVPGVLSQLPGLTKLSLAGNGLISQLRAEDFQQLQQLQELDISNLSLNSLPWDFFASFPRLRAVTAAENPFNCLCHMSWIVSWVRLGKASLRRPEETRCHFPPKNAGRLLRQMEYADFGCPTTTTSTSTLRATSPKLTSPLPSSRPLLPEASPAGPTSSDGGLTPSASLTPEGQPSPEAQLCPPHTCLNGGLCQPGPNHHPECLCPLGFTGLYCEVVREQVTSPPEPTQAKQIAIKHVGSTSVKVGLQNYIRSKTQLKGIRLTYWSLSGPDKRPITLSLPAALPEYTVRALKPNSSYHICVGALGDKTAQEELCVEAHTLHPSHQQHAPVAQSKGPDLPIVVAPSVAAVLLLLGLAAAGSYYVRQHRRQRKAHAAPGAPGSGPLELEGVAMCGEKGELVTQNPRTVAPLSLECEVPLMHPHFTGTATLQALGPSYF
ncbi:vasorin [Crotalus tigris]|uniref:vasorin n=1 Tax=Crotalus tigris TaxID=88082 RepID=UPI00192F9BC2|nr:vasorin [Crotalus tigris]XP_039216492.1 vasorin [Crotalus tigris]